MAKVARKTQKTSPAVLDGIDAHRDTVRKMGGFFAIALSIAVLIVGLLLLVIPGSITGVPGFVLTVI
ncbi:MAG: hypothetical protein F2712_03895, partial [Actinobacteria bacterium]|nr:hypothetical protein [Actinomycetota bacterium]